MIVAVDPESGLTLDTFAIHPTAVVSLATDPRGEFLAAAGTDGRVALWRIKCSPSSWETVEHRYPGYKSDPEIVILPTPRPWRDAVEVNWSPDGEHIVTWATHWFHGQPAFALQVWSREGELVWTGPHARQVDVHPTRRCLAAVLHNRVLLGWPGEGLRVIDLPGALDAVDFSPDGTKLVVGGLKKRLWILDAKDGSVLTRRKLDQVVSFFPEKEFIQRVRWSPSGELIAVSVGEGLNPAILDSKSLDKIWQGGPIGGRASEMFDVYWTPSETLMTGLGSVRIVDIFEGESRSFATGYDPRGVMSLHGTPDCLILSNGCVSRLAVDGDSIRWCRLEKAKGRGKNDAKRDRTGKAESIEFASPALRRLEKSTSSAVGKAP